MNYHSQCFWSLDFGGFDWCSVVSSRLVSGGGGLCWWEYGRGDDRFKVVWLITLWIVRGNSRAEYKRGWGGRCKVRMYRNIMHVEYTNVGIAHA